MVNSPRVEIVLGIEDAPVLNVVCANRAERDRLSDWICQDEGRAALVTFAGAVVGCWPIGNPDDDDQGDDE